MSWWNVLSIVHEFLGSSGTFLFVFIAGFLFYGVFYVRRTSYKEFMIGKFKKVFIPYLIFASILGMILLKYYPNWPHTFRGMIDVYFYGVFWYIPFIMCMYAGLPMFNLFIDQDIKIQLSIIMLSLIVSIGLGRHCLNPILSCIYFTPTYLYGIICAIYYDKIINCNVNIKFTVLFIAIGWLVFLQALNMNQEILFNPWEISWYQPPQLMVISKLLLCTIYLWVFHWLENSNYLFIDKLLMKISEYSFTIFFFQNFFIFIIYKFWVNQYHPDFIPFWVMEALYYVIALAFCFLTILLFYPLKKLLGKYSRMVIGS